MWARHSGLVGYLVLVIFVLVGLGVLYVEEGRTQDHVMDGTTCILGTVTTLDGYQAPPPELVDEACERYLHWVERE